VTDRGYVLGERHHRAKLADDDVRLILTLLNEGVPQRKVAEKFECSRRTVRDIGAGLSRCAIPDTYRPEKPVRHGVERARVMASRWPCRIKPAKPDEFDSPQKDGPASTGPDLPQRGIAGDGGQFEHDE
jgi:hypothetical protein